MANQIKYYALIASRWVRVYRKGYNSFATKKEPNIRFNGSLYQIKQKEG